MNKIVSSIGVVALCFGTMAMVHSRNSEKAELNPVTMSQATSAPYRDGLYEGKLAPAHRRIRGVPQARWARPEARAAFAAGFQEGCNSCHRTVAR